VFQTVAVYRQAMENYVNSLPENSAKQLVRDILYGPVYNATNNVQTGWDYWAIQYAIQQANTAITVQIQALQDAATAAQAAYDAAANNLNEAARIAANERFLADVSGTTVANYLSTWESHLPNINKDNTGVEYVFRDKSLPISEYFSMSNPSNASNDADVKYVVITDSNGNITNSYERGVSADFLTHLSNTSYGRYYKAHADVEANLVAKPTHVPGLTAGSAANSSALPFLRLSNGQGTLTNPITESATLIGNWESGPIYVKPSGSHIELNLVKFAFNQNGSGNNNNFIVIDTADYAADGVTVQSATKTATIYIPEEGEIFTNGSTTSTDTVTADGNVKLVNGPAGGIVSQYYFDRIRGTATGTVELSSAPHSHPGGTIDCNPASPGYNAQITAADQLKYPNIYVYMNGTGNFYGGTDAANGFMGTAYMYAPYATFNGNFADGGKSSLQVKYVYSDHSNEISVPTTQKVAFIGQMIFANIKKSAAQNATVSFIYIDPEGISGASGGGGGGGGNIGVTGNWAIVHR